MVRSRHPLLYVVTFEEERAERMITETAGRTGKIVFSWSVTEGMTRLSSRDQPAAPDSHDPVKALEAILDARDPGIFILRDFHRFIEEPRVARRLRDLARALTASPKTAVIIAPVLRLPDELELDVAVLDVPLPDREEMAQRLDSIIRAVSRDPKIRIDLPPAERERVLKAVQGLTLREAENAFAKAIVKDSSLTGADVQVLLDEKRGRIRKSGLLEYYEPEVGLADVGGLDHLKEWLRQRGRAFTSEAREFGLPEPKGLLLLGVQGCGKSLTAKAISSQWSLPLLRLDLGRVFGSFVGESEANLRRALKVADGLAPCVLWLDEAEKAFGGVGGRTNDGGTTMRVFGTFLTWLQEKRTPVFVVLTANEVSALPPELLRKGRLDEIFFLDLPAPNERQEIFRIHIARRRRDPARFDLAALAGVAEGFSGAEIEEAVLAGLYRAFDAGRDLGQQDLIDACEVTVPLSATMREPISRLRNWARNRARPASRVVQPA